MILFRDLVKVRGIIKNATDLDIMYAYDDLVFPEHGVFIIQFDDENINNYLCYFRKESSINECDTIYKNLINECKRNNCKIIKKGAFQFKQKDEKVEIHFT